MNSFDEFYENLPQGLCLNCGKCEKPFYLSKISCFERLPDGCGYTGHMFRQREIFKGKIRALKEEILGLSLELKNDNNCSTREKIKNEIQSKQDIIDSFSEYGSNDW